MKSKLSESTGTIRSLLEAHHDGQCPSCLGSGQKPYGPSKVRNLLGDPTVMDSCMCCKGSGQYSGCQCSKCYRAPEIGDGEAYLKLETSNDRAQFFGPTTVKDSDAALTGLGYSRSDRNNQPSWFNRQTGARATALATLPHYVDKVEPTEKRSAFTHGGNRTLKPMSALV